MTSYIALLPERSVVEVAGEDRVSILQGLVSNDVEAVEPGHAVWAALLTPQGKWLADFFILSDGARLLLDCEGAQAAMLVERLTRYKLRARVEISDVSSACAVHAAWGDPPHLQAAISVPDPRLSEAGWRILATAPQPTNANAAAWDRHRLALGLPDGSRDLEADKSVLMEAGFDELRGVSWTKGCFMGQELTARTKYRGLIKRRLVPVEANGRMPVPGTPVLSECTEVGTVRSGRDSLGLALLRIDALNGRLTSGDTRLTPRPPSWMRLPEHEQPTVAVQAVKVTT